MEGLGNEVGCALGIRDRACGETRDTMMRSSTFRTGFLD